MLKIFPSTLFHRTISIIVGDQNYILRATLDEGPRSNKMEHFYWTQGLYMRIQNQLRCHLHGIILEENSIGPDQKMELEGELMVWRTKM
jgi:hypothetical protein